MNQDLAARLASVKETLKQACKKSQRKPEEITLLAVSKFQPVKNILKAHELGQNIFGENYLQEAEEKIKEIAQLNLPQIPQWHFIGHLQTRKGRQAAGKFTLIHTLDSQKLAQELQKSLEKDDTVQKVLIEVNIGKEPQKSGVDPANIQAFAESVLKNYPCLILEGLMCMPPAIDSGEKSRRYFAELRELNDKLRKSLGLPLPHLSMGMSADYDVAIEEGATIIRVGTAIFGQRPTVKK